MRIFLVPCGLILAASFSAGPTLAGQQLPKDYLSRAEADKIRDEQSLSKRMKLFVSFAEDRIKKLQYEFDHPSNDRQRIERLNGLLNAYAGCIDDSAELIDLAREKQEDIRSGLKTLQSRGQEFLGYLKKISASGPNLEDYKENLDDAIEATQDALKDTEDALKELNPPPVRRR